uniref:Dynein regulatory complex protein 9 n=1 Tax=Eptatretus burgeri TaxID=7764 RepID=A0A8C4Q924_EPTBU
MQQLLGDRYATFDLSLLRELFLQHLPPHVHMILAANAELARPATVDRLIISLTHYLHLNANCNRRLISNAATTLQPLNELLTTGKHPEVFRWLEKTLLAFKPSKMHCQCLTPDIKSQRRQHAEQQLIREQRLLEEAELERRILAITIIQATWRGFCVRKMLKSFKRGKGKKGGKGKGKGKKKK